MIFYVKTMINTPEMDFFFTSNKITTKDTGKIQMTYISQKKALVERQFTNTLVILVTPASIAEAPMTA